MHVEVVSEANLAKAAYVHAIAWRESHRSICSDSFIAEHTTQRQMSYIRNAMNRGACFFMLTGDVPVAVVSIESNVIADLYVHPEYQRRGYGKKLLKYAMSKCDNIPTLWVLNTNQVARCMYERVGFVQSGKMKELKSGLYEIEMIYKKG